MKNTKVLSTIILMAFMMVYIACAAAFKKPLPPDQAARQQALTFRDAARNNSEPLQRDNISFSSARDQQVTLFNLTAGQHSDYRYRQHRRGWRGSPGI